MSSLFSIGEDEMDLDDEVKGRKLRSTPCTFVLFININLNSFTLKYTYRTKGKSSFSLEYSELKDVISHVIKLTCRKVLNQSMSSMMVYTVLSAFTCNLWRQET